ncbi:MAG: SDR family oxidoreductase [Lentisphaerae bacterium]|nr:SDR family oxidoreductase [Lentisphaerota bacterium]
MKQQDRIVIITGAARGIGYGIAECFAAAGDRIVVADLDSQQARTAAQRLKDEASARDAVGIPCDVADRASVAAMIDGVTAQFGRLDVLVNNAGICPFRDVMEMEPDTWEKTIDVNLNGAFHCTQLAAEKMIEQGDGGRVVFITSLAENVTQPVQVDYGASKAGMRMTMVGFATALGKHGITCNAVAPGMILTDMTRHHWERPGPAEEIKRRVPVGRIGTPRDIGHAVLFLASREAEYISGITLRVDGGHQALCV